MNSHVFGVLAWVAVARHKGVNLSLRTMDGYAVGTAKSRRRLDKGIEHGLQIEGRAADHLEHVGGSGLLLQRFREIVGASAQLVEQAGVLDGDHRLIGKALEQRDLFLVKRLDLRASNSNDPDGNPFTQQWGGEYGPNAGNLPPRLEIGKLSVDLCGLVMHVDGLAIDDRPGRWSPASERIGLAHGSRDRNRTAMCHPPIDIALDAIDFRVVCLTEPRGTIGDCIQYGLEIRR